MGSALRRAIWKFLVELQMCGILNNSAISLPGAYPTDRLIPMHNDTVQDYHCSLVPSNKKSQPEVQGVGWLLLSLHTHIRTVHSQNDNVGYLGGKI